jgi:hypothetical protein
MIQPEKIENPALIRISLRECKEVLKDRVLPYALRSTTPLDELELRNLPVRDKVELTTWCCLRPRTAIPPFPRP